MENILKHFNEKVISLTKNYLNNLIFSNGISSYTDDLVSEFATFGSDLTQYLIDLVEEEIFKINKEDKQFQSLEKDERNIVSIFGNITYKRRYYYDKTSKERVYLLDRVIGIKPNENLLPNVKERLIKEATESSYEHAGEVAAYGVKISKQEVKNQIEKLDLDIDFYEKNEEPRKVETIYIIADEDHVHLQKGGIEEPRIIIVYDNILSKGKRIELKNKRHFGGVYKNRIMDLWDEVALYIENTYDMDYVQRIFIQGDGASWIKTGKTWINKSINILDTFHMCKAVNAIAGKNEKENKKRLYIALRRLNFEEFKEISYEILSEEMDETRRINKEKIMNYILNNKEGISNLYKYRQYLHGCSAEGHVSHIFSDRMSSRPMGWKTQNVNNMSKLRLLKEDNIEIRTILEKQDKVIELDEYQEIKEKTKKRIHKNIDFKEVSLPIITFGNHEQRQLFKDILNGTAI